MCGVWCVVCGVWCVVCGVWCVVCAYAGVRGFVRERACVRESMRVTERARKGLIKKKTFVFTCVHAFMRTFMRACVCVRVCVHACVHSCVRAGLCACGQLHVDTTDIDSPVVLS